MLDLPATSKTVCTVAVLFSILVGSPGCAKKNAEGETVLKVERIEKVLKGGITIAFDGYYNNARAVEHGRCTVTYQNGPRCEMTYSHGLADGACKWYYADNSPAFQGIYRKGEPWDGVVIPVGMCMGSPHRYSSGKDDGVWTDPKGVFVDE